MAIVVRGERYESENELTILPEIWNLSHPIYPKGNNIRTDVMLIQIMLKVFFMSDLASYEESGKALAIFSSSRTRFDDGIYGANTRAVLDIYEVHSGAPYRDGIVRPIPPRLLYTKQYTKLNKLNVLWDAAMADGPIPHNKKEQARIMFHPLLYREMYGT